MDEGIQKKSFKIGDKTFEVKLNSDRHKLFRKNPSCVACGLTGEKFILETQDDHSAHLNFYAKEDGRLVLMTKDHIQAKAYGGPDSLDNYQTCCDTCNQLKASYPISYDNLRKLRNMLKNEDHLSTRDLRKQIQKARLSMMDCLNGQ
jgi:5-methylcytosine-specific restriction endonuclease McrA